MSNEEEYIPPPGVIVDPGSGIIAEALSPQLGTDPVALDSGRVDMRRLTVLDKEMLGPLLYASLRARSTRVWRNILDSYLNLSVSVGGRGRRDIIRMQGVSRGIPQNVESEIQRPNWLARNIYQRDWERRERERLGIE